MLSNKFGFIFIIHLMLFGTVDRIQKAIEKREYDKADELIIKGLEREPDNPGISYYQALLLFDIAYQNHNVDSARIIISEAQSKFEAANEEMIEDLEKDQITSEKIQNLFVEIRDQLFQNTIENLSISNAIEYQKKYPQSIYDNILSYKVDSMKFLNARKKGTQKALLDFNENNPTSVFKVTADSIIDYLRITDLEKSKRLSSYYDFIEKYPLSSYRERVEKYILKVSTASGKPDKLKEFLTLSQSNYLRKKAADVLYYSENKNPEIPHPKRDSLRQAHKLSKVELLPIVENGSIGFYDSKGGLRINPQYQNLSDIYTCELTSDDWIFIDGLILTKEGVVILSNVEQYRSISPSLGLIKTSEKWWLYHKSGFRVLEEPVEEAQVIDDWVKIKRKEGWGLVSILGLTIAEYKYDDIYKNGNFWIFEKDDLLAAYTKKLMLEEIEEKGLSLEFKFDDIEPVNNNSIIGFRDERECLLDSSLNFLIPWGEYEIYPEESGWYLRTKTGYKLYNNSEEDITDEQYPYLESNDGWLAVQTSKDWVLLPRNNKIAPILDNDSIKLVNNFACILFANEASELLFASGKRIPIENIQISTFPLESEFLLLREGTTSSIYNKEGLLVIDGEFEEVSFLNDTLMKVQIESKQGLINTKGKWILNPLFDSIDEKDGLILTLLDGKIGSFDPSYNELISANYEARITRLDSLYLTKKDGKIGLIDFDENEILSFSYDEIMVWNDTSYVVKKNQEYLIINQKEEVVYPPIEKMRELVQSTSQTIYLFISNGRYGLISNNLGELLSPEFTDIFNIGHADYHLFFADQHLDKAGFHVVSYVDENGKLVLSKAYTREEFDKILCDN